jgi:hypothetical protein
MLVLSHFLVCVRARERERERGRERERDPVHVVWWTQNARLHVLLAVWFLFARSVPCIRNNVARITVGAFTVV